MSKSTLSEPTPRRSQHRITRAATVRFARSLAPLVRELGFENCEVVVMIRRDTGETDERENDSGRASGPARPKRDKRLRGVYAAIARELRITRQAVHAAVDKGSPVILDMVAERLKKLDAKAAESSGKPDRSADS